MKLSSAMTFCFSRTIDKIEVCGTYRTIYLRTSNYDMLKSILLENWNATLDITFKYSFVFYHYCFNCVSPLLTFLDTCLIFWFCVFITMKMMFVKYFVKQRQMMKIENIITYRYSVVSNCDCLYNLIYIIFKYFHLLSVHLFR